MPFPVLGLDIGGPIIDRWIPNTEALFETDRYLETPATPGALTAIRRLVDERFGHRVMLISKSRNDLHEKRTRHWLAHHAFYDQTGVAQTNTHFCRRRDEKGAICRSLGVTHFIDDRLEVLAGIVAHMRIQFGNHHDEPTHDHLARHIHQVENWEGVLDLLLG